MRWLIVLFLVTPIYGGELRILFIGNSLTYSNDLPAMVRRIGELEQRKITTGVVAAPNRSLEDHLMDGDALRAIRGSPWDVVVLQQGPSSLDESRQLLIRDAIRMRKLAARHSAIALLTVWPDRGRLAYIDRVIESYRLAAEAVNGKAIPAGTAWKAAMVIDPAIGLYSSDGFHPSPLGTYLAALAVYQTIVAPLPEAATTVEGARHIAGEEIVATQLRLSRAAQR